MKPKITVVFDTETTGLLSPIASTLDHQPHITEIYCAKINHKGKIIEEFETFLKVPMALEKHIIKLTNITDSMLQGAPIFAEKYGELCDFFMGVDRVVAHNAPFDLGMLWVELSRLNREYMFPWPVDQYCTIEKSMYLENKRLKLVRLHEYATGAKEISGAHRAKTDTLALVRCYKWLEKQ